MTSVFQDLKPGEKVVIGDHPHEVTITAQEKKGRSSRLRIDAPPHIAIKPRTKESLLKKE